MAAKGWYPSEQAEPPQKFKSETKNTLQMLQTNISPINKTNTLIQKNKVLQIRVLFYIVHATNMRTLE